MALFQTLGIDTVQEVAQLFLTVGLGVVVIYMAIQGLIDPDMIAGSFMTILGFWFRGSSEAQAQSAAAQHAAVVVAATRDP